MSKWLTSKNRKRHQRAMNAAMKELNDNIKRDSLWNGRFYVRQDAAHWVQYADGSGAELWVLLQFIDKATGKVWEQLETVNHWRFGAHLWWSMNDFIVNQSGVWEENPRPGSPEWFEKNRSWN